MSHSVYSYGTTSVHRPGRVPVSQAMAVQKLGGGREREREREREGERERE